jgi:hypothetical protein
MKNLFGLMVITVLGLSVAGCESSFWGGTATGAGAGVLGTGGAYEYRMNQEMKRIDEDLKTGKITQQEYDIRKDQIKRDSVLK